MATSAFDLPDPPDQPTSAFDLPEEPVSAFDMPEAEPFAPPDPEAQRTAITDLLVTKAIDIATETPEQRALVEQVVGQEARQAARPAVSAVWTALEDIDRPANAVRGAIYETALYNNRRMRAKAAGLPVPERSLAEEATMIASALTKGFYRTKVYTGEEALKEVGVLTGSPGWRSAAGIALDLVVPDPISLLSKPLKAGYKLAGKSAEAALVRANMAETINRLFRPKNRLGVSEGVKEAARILDALPRERDFLKARAASHMRPRQNLLEDIVARNPELTTEVEQARILAGMESNLNDAAFTRLNEIDEQQLARALQADMAAILIAERAAKVPTPELSADWYRYAAGQLTPEIMQYWARKKGAQSIGDEFARSVRAVLEEQVLIPNQIQRVWDMPRGIANEVMQQFGFAPPGVKMFSEDPIQVALGRIERSIDAVTAATAMRRIAEVSGVPVDLNRMSALVSNVRTHKELTRKFINEAIAEVAERGEDVGQFVDSGALRRAFMERFGRAFPGELGEMGGDINAVARRKLSEFMDAYDGMRIYTDGPLKGIALPDDVAKFVDEWAELQSVTKQHGIIRRWQQFNTFWKAHGLAFNPAYFARNIVQNFVSNDLAKVGLWDYIGFASIQWKARGIRRAIAGGWKPELGRLSTWLRKQRGSTDLTVGRADLADAEFLEQAVLSKHGHRQSGPVVKFQGKAVSYGKVLEEFEKRHGQMGPAGEIRSEVMRASDQELFEARVKMEKAGPVRRALRKVGQYTPIAGPVGHSKLGNENKAIQFMFSNLGDVPEANARGAHFMSALRKLSDDAGNLPDDAFDQAWDSVLVHLYDYTNPTLSKFERERLKVVFPFYGFMRRNLPAQIRHLMTNPGRVARVQRARANIESATSGDEWDGTWIREWQETGLPIRVGRLPDDPNTQQIVLLASYLGIGDLQRVAGFENLLETAVMMTSPVVKWTPEVAIMIAGSEHDDETGWELGAGIDVARSIIEGDPVRLGRSFKVPWLGGMMVDARLRHFLEGLISVNSLVRWNPYDYEHPMLKQPSLSKRTLQYFTGVRAYTASLERVLNEKERQIEGKLRQARGDLRWAENTGAMPEAEAASARVESLLRRLNKVRARYDELVR